MWMLFQAPFAAIVALYCTPATPQGLVVSLVEIRTETHKLGVCFPNRQWRQDVSWGLPHVSTALVSQASGEWQARRGMPRPQVALLHITWRRKVFRLLLSGACVGRTLTFSTPG